MKKSLLLLVFSHCVQYGHAQLYLSPGATLQHVGNTVLTLQNTSFLSHGAFVPGTGTVYFTGNANQSTFGVDFYNLTVNKPNAAADLLQLGSNALVANVLELVDGCIHTQTHKLVLGANATVAGETGGNYVLGILESSRTVNASTENFGGMGIAIDAAAGSNNLGEVVVSRTSGIYAPTFSYIQNQMGQQSIDRIWSVTPANQPATPVGVTLSWLPDNDNGNTDFSAAQIWKSSDNGATWHPVGSPQDASDRSITTTFNGFSRITVGASNVSFPVKWLEVSVNWETEHQTIARIRWATAIESENANFTIERSVNDLPFSPIGTVNGHGTTSDQHHYHFPDSSARMYSGPVLYRIRQTDYNGNTTHSNIVELSPSPRQTSAHLYPNPVQDLLQVELPTGNTATLLLYNTLSQLVFTLDLFNNITTINTNHLKNGIYTYHINCEGRLTTGKLIKE